MQSYHSVHGLKSATISKPEWIKAPWGGFWRILIVAKTGDVAERSEFVLIFDLPENEPPTLVEVEP